MDRIARTLPERIEALGDRDKLLRSNRVPQTNIETAVAVVGNCPDMCPEYERYFREENNQLSSLEMINGTPDPYAMIKEYRGAGSAQEEPLPHELRSPEALSRTMDYLICNIIDRVEQEPEIVGDWYDFIWTRCRAIRKDLTQQHLCDPISVSLLEKCARFHIHCGYALCEEDSSVFSVKINQENLSKCLSTLKDFYNDLSRKEIRCPNESEFRCYYLLNFLQPEILFEMARYPTTIRDSEPVLFALHVYYALNTNNFFKFFDLVKKASYLQSCLLHRYFYDIRLFAFRIMCKAFSTSNRKLVFSASNLIQLLCFNDDDELNSFCHHLGLEYNIGLGRERSVSSETKQIIIKGEPKQVIRLSRIIEEKKCYSPLSVIVNGEPLPDNPYKKHYLSSSFDQNDRLISKPQACLENQPKESEKRPYQSAKSFGLIRLDKLKSRQMKRSTRNIQVKSPQESAPSCSNGYPKIKSSMPIGDTVRDALWKICELSNLSSNKSDCEKSMKEAKSNHANDSTFNITERLKKSYISD